MFLRLAAGFAALTLVATPGFSETIDLRNSCDTWEQIPANDALKSPVAALLQCTDDNGTWLVIQIMCFTQSAEIEFRYRPGYPIISPIPAVSDTQASTTPIVDQIVDTTTEDSEPALIPMGQKEMLFFDFPKLGVTNVVNYDFSAGDWSYREKEPLAPLFKSLITGNYVDVALLASGITERLPLRGSTKAIRPVVEACRIAKIKRDKAAAKVSQD